jgi:hypothetical protein
MPPTPTASEIIERVKARWIDIDPRVFGFVTPG